MDIWMIRDGEKCGPFADYDIRSKIEAGELGPDDPVWHEGLDGWKPLSEVVSFRSLFERPAPVPPPLPKHALPAAPGQKIPMARRFWARWFDLQFYCTLWWGGLWLSGQDLGHVLTNSWMMVFQLLPWFLIEAALIHRFGTTPGKALLGISVENEGGGALDISQSFTRAMRVYLSGIGMGVAYLCQICMTLNWVIGRKMGMTLWDRSGGHRLVYRPLQEWRIILVVFLLIGFVWIQFSIQLPALLASDAVSPEIKAFYEKALSTKQIR